MEIASAAKPAGIWKAALASARREGIERIAFWLLVLGLAWVPFWYGSNVLCAWGINAVWFPGLVLVYEIALLLRGEAHPVGIRHLAMPAALFAAVTLWIGFQSLAWAPAPLVNPIWAMAANVLGRPLGGGVSVDRDLTFLALIRLLTAASVFWLAVQLCREEGRALRLVRAIGVIGSGYAAYGLIALKTGPLPWLDIQPDGEFLSSTFVNRDTYASYAGVGIVATAGLIVHFYRRKTAGAAGQWRLQAASVIEATGRQGSALLAGGFLIAVALMLTGSRGGIAASLLGLVAVGVLAWRRQGSEKGAPNWILLALFVLVGAVGYGFSGVFADKLKEGGVYDASRVAVYILTLRSTFDVPLTGWGYGTFADVFPMYRDHSLSVDGMWMQAHNTYIEVFQGLGFVFGAMLLLIVLILVLRTIRGATRRRKSSIVPCITAGTAVVVGMHSLVDFSLQVQAVALTFVALLGAGVAQSASLRSALAD